MLLCAQAAAQVQPFPQNKIEFRNYWLQGAVEFPGFRSPAGNRDGDGLFQVLPAELLDRGSAHQVSGYKITFRIHAGYTGSFPILATVPGVQFYRTRVVALGGQEYETLDPGQPVGPRYPPVNVALATNADWEVEVRFAPGASNPLHRQLLSVPAEVGGRRAGLAMLVLAPPGQRAAANVPGVVLLQTFQERHLGPGRPSHSGSLDSATGAIAMFGQFGQPSATGELAVGFRFADPTLQLQASTAGGLNPDPNGWETYAGPGAYAGDLASRGGFLGLYVQATHLSGGWAIPLLVGQGAAGPTATLPVAGVPIRFTPGQEGLATLFFQSGVYGRLGPYRAASGAGFAVDQPGVWTSGRLAVPAGPGLLGLDLWLQSLLLGPDLAPRGATNSLRLSLR